MLRFASIEGLRAWLAWWVVAHHALQLAGVTRDTVSGPVFPRVLALLEHASSAVNVFIIVSGFVITHLLLNRREKYLPYLLRRWMRIFPIFLVALLIAIALRPFYLEAYTQNGWVSGIEIRSERAALETEYFSQHLLLHLSMLHGIVPDEILKYAASSILVPGWSLSLEWQFYLLAPFIVSALLTRWKAGALLLATGLLSTFWLRDHTGFTWQYPAFLPLALPFFLIGISSRMLITETGWNRAFWGVVALSSIALFSSPIYSDRLAIAIWALFFVIVLQESGRIRLPFRPLHYAIRAIALNPVLAELGKRSYSTYLLHIPVFSLIVGGGAFLLDEHFSQTAAIALVALAVLATVPVSWAAYALVEAPFLRLGNTLARSLSTRDLSAPAPVPEGD